MEHKNIMYRLNTTLMTIDTAYEKIAKNHGITFNSLMLLYTLRENENVTQSQVCKQLLLPKSTVHSILQKFIKEQSITLTTGDNKKEKIIVVTEIGKERFKSIYKDINTFEENLLHGLGTDNCNNLLYISDLVTKIINKN